MSRCLPFPPPNYEKNGIGGETLKYHLQLRRKRAEFKKEKEIKEKEEKKREEKERKRRKKMDPISEEYDKLTVNWVPLPLDHHVEEEEDWLFSTNDKQNKASGTKDVSRSSNPKTTDATKDDIYALPYVLPY